MDIRKSASVEKLASIISQGDDTKDYLMSTVIPDLVDGLTEMSISHPSNPHVWLAEFLVSRAPATEKNSPVVTRMQVQPPPKPVTSSTSTSSSTATTASSSSSSSSKPLRVIIAGAPASGKGTQCELIVEKFGLKHISTGDVLRAAVKAGSDLGKQAKEYMDRGDLVPDGVIIAMVKECLSSDECSKNGWLLDGFPRTRAQADALAEAGITADCFILLDVPSEILVERVCGRRTDPETGKIYHMTFNPPENEEIAARLVQRSDDTEEKIKVRVENFNKHVDAISECYESITVKVNGNQDKNTVFSLIDSALSG